MTVLFVWFPFIYNLLYHVTVPTFDLCHQEDYFFDKYGEALPIRWLSPETMLPVDDGVALRHITKESNIW